MFKWLHFYQFIHLFANNWMNCLLKCLNCFCTRTATSTHPSSESLWPLRNQAQSWMQRWKVLCTTFPRFYWNVTCIPKLKHNYIDSQGPSINGILSQCVILLMQRNSFYNNFHCKVLIITDTWIIKCNFGTHPWRSGDRMVQIIIITWELLFRSMY